MITFVGRSSQAVALPSSEPARRLYRAAKQRFDDALLLLEMGRTTAAVYLAGYSVECMLKALILAAVPQAQAEEVLGLFRGARAHDYEWLLHLYAEKGGAQIPPSVVPHFARVNSWSTDMRYVPGTIALREAHAFVDAATTILTWVDGRLSPWHDTIEVPNRTPKSGRSCTFWRSTNVPIPRHRSKDADTVPCRSVCALSIPIFMVRTASSGSWTFGDSCNSFLTTCLSISPCCSYSRPRRRQSPLPVKSLSILFPHECRWGKTGAPVAKLLYTPSPRAEHCLTLVLQPPPDVASTCRQAYLVEATAHLRRTDVLLCYRQGRCAAGQLGRQVTPLLMACSMESEAERTMRQRGILYRVRVTLDPMSLPLCPASLQPLREAMVERAAQITSILEAVIQISSCANLCFRISL